MATSTTASVHESILDALVRHRRLLYTSGRVPGGIRGSFAVHPSGLAEAPGELLRDLVVREQAITTIETGFALGLSTLFLVEGLLIAGRGTPAHTAIDPYQTRDWVLAGERTVRDAGVRQFVEIIEQDSTLVLPRFAAEGRQFDVAFVDGGHHFDTAFADLLYMHRVVRPGGLIVVDDVWMPAVRTAVSYFLSNFGTTAETVAHAGAKRFAILRVPSSPVDREWDHFVRFSVD